MPKTITGEHARAVHRAPETPPPPGGGRLVTLDLIRGVAILGILAINVSGFAGPAIGALSPDFPSQATSPTKPRGASVPVLRRKDAGTLCHAVRRRDRPAMRTHGYGRTRRRRDPGAPPVMAHGIRHPALPAALVGRHPVRLRLLRPRPPVPAAPFRPCSARHCRRHFPHRHGHRLLVHAPARSRRRSSKAGNRQPLPATGRLRAAGALPPECRGAGPPVPLWLHRYRADQAARRSVLAVPDDGPRLERSAAAHAHRRRAASRRLLLRHMAPPQDMRAEPWRWRDRPRSHERRSLIGAGPGTSRRSPWPRCWAKDCSCRTC